MIENPKIIQRPIVVKDHLAVIGDPIENIEKLF
jgi:arsenate reductase-like glutaredoxin family protein